MLNAMIHDIQRGSVHDGPGLRTVVFLKGCQLRCFWCHNPDAISPVPQLLYDAGRCLHCGACAQICDAHRMNTEGRHEFDRSRCICCFRCVPNCLAGALTVAGHRMSLDEVWARIAEDLTFFRQSGGGVTISGGEPGCQAEFTAALLARCRENGVDTAIETNLDYDWTVGGRMFADCDRIMADLKHIDSSCHRAGTGDGNERILANFRRLPAVPLMVRTPVVAGFNDTAETIGAIAAFVASLPHPAVYELLRCHPLGCEKARRAGMADRITPPGIPSLETMKELARAACEAGIPVLLNGREFHE